MNNVYWHNSVKYYCPFGANHGYCSLKREGIDEYIQRRNWLPVPCAFYPISVTGQIQIHALLRLAYVRFIMQILPSSLTSK